jgi:hypothetical protein
MQCAAAMCRALPRDLPTGGAEAPLVVFASERLRAVCHAPHRSRLVVSFDYLRPGRAGFPGRAPPPQMMQAEVAHLMVETAQNDWFLNPDLAALRAALGSFTAGFDDVAAIGFSFGGYGALLMAQALHLRRALLVSPQFSIFPERVPFESRYALFAARLDPGLDDLGAEGAAGLRGCIVFDPRLEPADARHAALIRARFPGLRSVAMPFGGHPALRLVGEAHLFARVQALLMGDAVTPAALHRLHRAARARAPSYALQLARYHAARPAA